MISLFVTDNKSVLINLHFILPIFIGTLLMLFRLPYDCMNEKEFYDFVTRERLDFTLFLDVDRLLLR